MGVHEPCAGMERSKRDAKVCVRTPGTRAGTYRKTLGTYGAMRHDIAALGDYLAAEQVSMVLMEATEDYWKPYCYGLESRVNLMLVNARHTKNLPGRKTDISNAIGSPNSQLTAWCAVRSSRPGRSAGSGT